MDEISKSKIVQYTGPLALNSRSIQQAYCTLFNRDTDGNKLDDKQITINELTNLLSFLEAFVMSDGLYFDGTIPPLDLEVTKKNIYELKNKLGLTKSLLGRKFNISPIHTKNTEDLLNVCKESAEQASELIVTLDPQQILINNIDEPVKGNITNFLSLVKDNYQNNEMRKQVSLDILSEIVKGNPTFRGSKCVAGVLVAECENYDLLNIVKDKLNLCKNEKQKRCLIAALINRFRTNYINAQASKKKAAYLANPNIESLKNQQILLLWKYIFRKLKQSFENEMSNDLTKLFKGEYRSFPIGFVVLMRTRSNNPFDLFETAFKIKEPIFNKIIAHKTPQKRFIHHFDEIEYQDLEEKLLSELYYEIDTEKHKKTPKFYNFMNFIIPVIIGVATGSAFTSFVNDVNIASIITAKAAASSTSIVTKKMLNYLNPNRRYNIYLDNFQKLKDFYVTSLKHEKIGKSLSDQVESIFKRKLLLI